MSFRDLLLIRSSPKKAILEPKAEICIIGGGLVGLMVGAVAASHDCIVTLFEKGGHPGGTTARLHFGIVACPEDRHMKLYSAIIQNKDRLSRLFLRNSGAKTFFLKIENSTNIRFTSEILLKTVSKYGEICVSCGTCVDIWRLIEALVSYIENKGGRIILNTEVRSYYEARKALDIHKRNAISVINTVSHRLDKIEKYAWYVKKNNKNEYRPEVATVSLDGDGVVIYEDCKEVINFGYNENSFRKYDDIVKKYSLYGEYNRVLIEKIELSFPEIPHIYQINSIYNIRGINGNGLANSIYAGEELFVKNKDGFLMSKTAITALFAMQIARMIFVYIGKTFGKSKITSIFTVRERG